MFGKTLYEELIKFSKKDKVRAHMPGHNGGEGLSSKFKRNAFKIDLTELDGTDELRDPRGLIKKSLERAANAFGAKRTYYLVNGSTLGLEAAILAAAKPGDSLIVDRACHKSVISAMILGQVTPIFIEPDFADAYGIYGSMSPITVMDALSAHPEAAGVVLTCPTYYGVCSDVERLAKNIHAAGKFLIVDEAHGAHFAFSEELPRTALSQGADLVVQSAHKTLPSMGQTALLHLGGTNRISEEQVTKCINLLQTSSPSYIMLAAIDEAIHTMTSGGAKRLKEITDKLTYIKSKIGVLDKVSCVVKSGLENNYDITKLVVDFSGLGISGYGAAELLKRDYGIYPEMADERNVLFYITAGTTLRDLDLIDRAITDISKAEYKPQPIKKQVPLPSIELAMDMRKAFDADSETISPENAAGRICAEIVDCCPPCVPICVPGQLINNEIIDYITEYTDIDSISVVSGGD